MSQFYAYPRLSNEYFLKSGSTYLWLGDIKLTFGELGGVCPSLVFSTGPACEGGEPDTVVVHGGDSSMSTGREKNIIKEAG